VRYRFRGALWMHTGEGAWHFVTLPLEIADEIDELTTTSRAGFGSVPVTVTVGETTWQTSIFPDRKAASYLLPVKKQVRAREGIDDGDDLEIELVLRNT